MADIAQNTTLNVIRDTESSDTHHPPGNPEHERSQSPQSSIADTPSSPPPPADIERPRTPPQRMNATPEATPRTPNTVRDGNIPSTPRTGPKSASVYLSSPIRRHRNHTNLLSSGAMTPGRPSLKMGGVPLPGSPYRPSRHLGSSFGGHLGGSLSPDRFNSSFTSVGSNSSFSGGSGGPGRSSQQVPASPSGRVQFDSKETLPSMPLQTMMMTAEQASQLDDLTKAKELLVLAIEQNEKFRKAAQQFRNHANNLIFQQKLAQIEREENEQRHEVETSIQQREIEKLVTDIMGYSDKSIGTDQIRRKLKKTKGRLREMEEQLEQRDNVIRELRERVYVPNVPGVSNVPSMHGGVPGVPGVPGVQAVPPHMPAGPGVPTPGVHAPGMPYASHPGVYESPEKRRPPPIDTQLASEQSRTEPLSDLEVIASQVLSSGIQRKDHIPPPMSAISQPSPYQSPFYAPFSPFAAPPQAPRPMPSSGAQFGSPEKRRRQSSSSTISAMSEDDTLEEQ